MDRTDWSEEDQTLRSAASLPRNARHTSILASRRGLALCRREVSFSFHDDAVQASLSDTVVYSRALMVPFLTRLLPRVQVAGVSILHSGLVCEKVVSGHGMLGSREVCRREHACVGRNASRDLLLDTQPLIEVGRLAG